MLNQDVLRPSENRWDWLGAGAYYWEGAPERAMDWAKKHCKDPAVLGAVIDLGHCMNQTVFTHNGFPKVGIRPIIDGRRRGVRESLEDQTMAMG